MAEHEQLARELAGDVDGAFAGVVREFQHGLYATALRLTRSRQDAEDLTQEALTSAYRALCGYDPERIRGLQLRGWLWTILLNLIRNRARTRSRKPPARALESGLIPVAKTDPAAVAVATVDIAKALSRLGRREQEVLVLRYVADLSFAEIATATGMPIGTAKSHAHRSLDRLRRILEQEER